MNWLCLVVSGYKLGCEKEKEEEKTCKFNPAVINFFLSFSLQLANFLYQPICCYPINQLTN